MLVKLGQRGTVTLPKDLREGLPEQSLFEAIRRPDGVIELRPQQIIDASQAWFWTERWQQMEREADESYAAGRWQRFEDAESLIAYLDADLEP